MCPQCGDSRHLPDGCQVTVASRPASDLGHIRIGKDDVIMDDNPLRLAYDSEAFCVIRPPKAKSVKFRLTAYDPERFSFLGSARHPRTAAGCGRDEALPAAAGQRLYVQRSCQHSGHLSKRPQTA